MVAKAAAASAVSRGADARADEATVAAAIKAARSAAVFVGPANNGPPKIVVVLEYEEEVDVTPGAIVRMGTRVVDVVVFKVLFRGVPGATVFVRLKKIEWR